MKKEVIMLLNLFPRAATKQGGGQQRGGGSRQQQGKKKKQQVRILQVIDPMPLPPLRKQISDLQRFGGTGQLVARSALNTMTIQNQMMRNTLQRFRDTIEKQTEYVLRIRDPDADMNWDVHFFYTIRVPQTIPPRIMQKAQQLRKHYRMIGAQHLSSDIHWSIQREGLLFPCVSITSGQDGQLLSTNLRPTPMIDVPFFRTLLTSAPYDFHLPRPTDNSPANLLRHVSKEIVRMKERCHRYALELQTLLSDRISDRITLMSTIQDMLRKTG